MITGHFVGNSVVSTSPGAFSLYESSRFGEKKDKKVFYADVEALYLVERGKMQVVHAGRELDFDALMKRFSRGDKKLSTKYVVYSHLRTKGYVVKTALKFGAEFRVYEKGVKPGDEHAKWVVFSVSESERIDWHGFAAQNRVAHSTRKKLLLAVVDAEEDVTFYEVGWMRV